MDERKGADTCNFKIEKGLISRRKCKELQINKIFRPAQMGK